MKSRLSPYLLLLLSVAPWAAADTMQLRCVYTEVTYDAPFMAAPQTRQCPESKCGYDLMWDTSTGAASVDGVGYQLTQTDDRVMLTKTSVNSVVGGVDKASFSVEKSTLAFRSIRQTPPDVKLTIAGQCTSY